MNDFLPSGKSQYAADEYAFPLPQGVKTYFIERSKLASFLADSYDRLLLMLNVRVDFMDDILEDFDGYQNRFATDVQLMADLVIAQHNIPFVSMVLHQFPRIGDRGHQATLAAEAHLKAARIQLVESRPYFAAYDGRRLLVSPWEHHPNELANALFASMLYPTVDRNLAQPHI